MALLVSCREADHKSIQRAVHIITLLTHAVTASFCHSNTFFFPCSPFRLTSCLFLLNLSGDYAKEMEQWRWSCRDRACLLLLVGVNWPVSPPRGEGF